MANGNTIEQSNVTTPLGFFSNTIEPVFNEDIFTEDNLSEEVQKPDLTSPLVLRDQIMQAAGDEELSLTEFDASANLARQTLISDLSEQDVFTRSKRDLQFNISAEQGIQFQQGRQLLSDIDAFVDSQRATVVQREYEKELERQEELLKEEKKEQLQLMAMQMGIDPDGMSRKDLRSAIAGTSAERYSRTLSAKGRKGGSGSGGSGKCPEGMSIDTVKGGCYFTDVLDASRYFDDVASGGGQVPAGVAGPETDSLQDYLFQFNYTPAQVKLAIDHSNKQLPVEKSSGSSSGGGGGGGSITVKTDPNADKQ